MVTERRAEREAELIERYGVTDGRERRGRRAADTVVLVVKPQDMGGLLDEIAPTRCGPAPWSSRSPPASRPPSSRSGCPTASPVVRVMPNTPALVDQGMAAISPGRTATRRTWPGPSPVGATGQVVGVPEHYQDAVTAICGSGPAYLFFVVEAMIEAGVHSRAAPRRPSTELVVQTMFGAATMLRETGEHPTVLREQVTSPAGTTAAALRELEDHKVRAAFLTAMEAARDRSRELASGQG